MNDDLATLLANAYQQQFDAMQQAQAGGMQMPGRQMVRPGGGLVNPNEIPQSWPLGGLPGIELGGGMAWDRNRMQREPLNMQGTLRLPLPSVPGVQPSLDVTGGYGWGQGPQRGPLGAGNLGVRLGIKVPF